MTNIDATYISNNPTLAVLGAVENELLTTSFADLPVKLSNLFGPLMDGRTADISADPGKMAEILDMIEVEGDRQFIIKSWRLGAARRVPGADLEEILEIYQQLLHDYPQTPELVACGAISDAYYNAGIIAATLGNFTLAQMLQTESGSTAPNGDDERIWRARTKETVDMVSHTFVQGDKPYASIDELFTMYQELNGDCTWIKNNVPLHIAGFLLLLPKDKRVKVERFDDCFNLATNACLKMKQGSPWFLVGHLLYGEHNYDSSSDEWKTTLQSAKRFLDEQDAKATPSSSIAWCYRAVALTLARHEEDVDKAIFYADHGLEFLQGVGGTEVAEIIVREIVSS